MGKRQLSRLPWITREGYVDMLRIPLESTYAAAVSADPRQVRNALRVLQSAAGYGRTEASLFLMGFFVSRPSGDWEMRIEAVEALRFSRTKECADLLFSEIRRVKYSNTTRRYLNKILDVLAQFPRELVQEEFERLHADTSFSYRARAKFEACLYRDEESLQWP